MTESDPRLKAVYDSLHYTASRRRDSFEYVDGLIVRQRVINNHVVNFASDLLPQGAKVLDGCAGPEGSYLAAVQPGRNYEWYGNNISETFAHTLKAIGAENASVSDFAQLAYQDESFDGLFLVFAVNEFIDLRSSFAQANRVLKPGGIFTVTDSGPTISRTRVILQSLLTDEEGIEQDEYFAFFDGSRESLRIDEQFAKRPYSIDDFTDFLLKHVYGMPRTDAKYLAEEIAHGGFYNPTRCFQDILNHQYFALMNELIHRAGFRLEKTGLGASFKPQNPRTRELDTWESTPIVNYSKGHWIYGLARARSGENTRINNAGLRTPFRYGLSYPVLSYRKVK